MGPFLSTAEPFLVVKKLWRQRPENRGKFSYYEKILYFWVDVHYATVTPQR